MDIESTPLKDCYLIYNQLHGDHRGFFMEAFNQPKFQHLGLTFQLQQINVAKSKKKGIQRPSFSTRSLCTN